MGIARIVEIESSSKQIRVMGVGSVMQQGMNRGIGGRNELE
jgi:hypothetical protein